jgi:hypothetical protein
MPSEIVGQSELRDGSGSVKAGKLQTLIFTSRYRYIVLASSKDVTREEILLLTPGLPIINLVYGPTNQKCMSKTANRMAVNPLYWEVIAEFESGQEDQKQSPDNPDSPDPVTWIPLFKIDSFETKQRVLHEDFSNPPKKIVNFAKQPFAEPLTRTVTICSFSLVQFEDASQDINEIMDRNDTINQSSFRGRAAKTCKLNVTGAELGYFGFFPAWRISYKVTYDPDTWETELLEVGSVYKDVADGGKIKPYLDETNSHRIVGKLKADGDKLGYTADPLTSKFLTYKQISFDFIRS